MELTRKIGLKYSKTSKYEETLNTGDSVGVYVKVKEGEKERVQLYEGVVIKMQGSGASRTFTVRKISSGIGVERTFPFSSPSIDRVEVRSQGKVRRARLFFLRNLKGRAARLSKKKLLSALGADSAAAESAPAESLPDKA